MGGMAHDPVGLLQHKTYRESWTFDVPRIDGKIDGKEIPPREQGNCGYIGTISIHDGKMTVSLSFDNYDFHRLDRFSWNGSYTLVEKKAGPDKK